jgi:hypothetical protein
VSNYVWGWVLFGLGALIVGLWGHTLIQDRRRPSGRHSLDREKPLDQTEDWRGLRFIAVATLIVWALFMSAAKHPGSLLFAAKTTAVVATIIVVIWEFRSWGKITDPAARRNARSSARWFFVPTMGQVLLLLHIWDNGPARIIVGITGLLILAGPDVEPWIRRQLQRRAGGSAA